MTLNNETVLSLLDKIVYPDKPDSIVALGMVQDIVISGQQLTLSLMLPPLSPFKKSIQNACTKAIKDGMGADTVVEIRLLAKSTVGRTDDGKVLPGVNNIIAVASGKGGVGKSTVAVNLAVALAAQGYKVGLLDADIYGPSLPKMFGSEDAKPVAEKRGDKEMIQPIMKYGVKTLSIGYFVSPEQAMLWRGPMATSALQQFINEGDWGKLDYLLIDLPPGTGDIHLTLVQTIPVTGAVIVSTPQEVAIADVVKGISMFNNDKIKVPVLGLVENMSWFTPAELPDNKYYIFGRDGGKNIAAKMNIELLGQIPLVQSVCEGGDKGVPAATDSQSATGSAFMQLADAVVARVEQRNKTLAPTKVVEITNTEGCSSTKK